MNLINKIQLKKVSVAIGTMLLVVAFSIAPVAHAQYDDYSSTGYTSGADYGSTGYYSGADYSSTGYSSYGYGSTGYSGYDSGYSSTGYTNPADYSSTGYYSGADYSSTGYTSPYDYSSTGYTSPSDYSSTVYTAPYNYESTGYTTPSTYDSTGYNTNGGYSSTGYNTDTYGSTGYNTPSTYSSTGYNTVGYTPTYGSTGYNTVGYTPSYNNPGYVFTGGGYSCGSSCGGSYYPSHPYIPVTPYIPQQPVPNNISGSCVANTSSANIGDTVTWSVVGVSGGIGAYTYSWTGTDGLVGSASSVVKSYATAGSKSATVVIRAGSQSITRNCYTNINTPFVPPVTPATLSASCSANQGAVYSGDYVTWSASASGGNGGYSYYWSGTDGLSGNGSNAYHTYTYPGTKYANVTVSSGGQSVTRTCSLYVNDRYVYNNPPVYNPPVYQAPIYQTPVYQYPVYQTTYYPSNPYQATLHSISLSQVPYTGLDSRAKLILFIFTLIAWSAAVTYVLVIRKKTHEELVAVGVPVSTVASTPVVSRGGASEYWPNLGGMA